LVLYTRNNKGVQIKVDEMGRTHSMQVEMKKAYKTLVIKPEGKNQQENTCINGRIILKWILEKQGVKLVDLIHLAQDKGQWQAHVIMVKFLRIPQNMENFLASWETISLSQMTLLH
jgi:hypothetical protein